MHNLRQKKHSLFLGLLFLVIIQTSLSGQSELIVRVNNVSINGDLKIHGLISDFPYPILTSISVVDSLGSPIIGLADTTAWLGMDDFADNGQLISEIWNPVLEYLAHDTSSHDFKDIYQQFASPMFTEVRNNSDIPISTMLVMDVSTSMENQIADAQEGAELYVQSMRQGDRGGLVQFAGEIVENIPITSDKQVLMDALAESQSKISNGTAVYDAIMVGIRGTRDEKNRQAIIVYTDGKDNRSDYTPEAIIDSARVYNVPVHTVALGRQTDESYLREIAARTGGFFFKAETAEEMKGIYLTISKAMQNYYVMAHGSPFPHYDYTWRIIDVTTEPRPDNGRGKGTYFIGRFPKEQSTDLELILNSETENQLITSSDTLNIALPGDQYTYELNIGNLGPVDADTVRLFHQLPNSINYLSAEPAPQARIGNLLFWQFDNVAYNSTNTLRVTVEIPENLPANIKKIISEAKVFAHIDTIWHNNQDADTVFIRALPPPPQKYDLTHQQFVDSDTTISINGINFPAVATGNPYQYRLDYTNLGPGTAYDITFWDLPPNTVSFSNFNFIPKEGRGDTLFWKLDSLEVNQNFEIEFTATVNDSVPYTPFPLIGESGVIAQLDSFPSNNSVITTIYAVPPPVIPPRLTDLSVSLVSETDSTITIDNQTKNVIQPNEQFRYILNIQNPGQFSADSVVLTQVLPDSVTLLAINKHPLSYFGNQIVWYWDEFPADTTFLIRLDMQLNTNISRARELLTSIANIEAVNDTSIINNNDADTILVRHPEIIPSKNFNLQISQTILSNEMIVIDNGLYAAISHDDTAHFELQVKNHGPIATDSYLVWDVLPPSVMVQNFSPKPAATINDSLFWEFDSLAVNATLSITYDVILIDSFATSPFKLVNECGIIAINDTLMDDNYSMKHFYAIQDSQPPEPEFCDITVHQFVRTDSFELSGADTIKFVKPGEIYNYSIRIDNISDVNAKNIKIRNVLPDFVSISEISPTPFFVNADSIVWYPPEMEAGGHLLCDFSAKVDSQIPEGQTLLHNAVIITAANEDSTKLSDNASSSRVYAVYYKPQLPEWSLAINANPFEVEVGNTVTIDVNIPVPVTNWDIRVHQADGQIDSTFADEFISITNPPVSQIIVPKYKTKRMFLENEREPLRFELRATDKYGQTKSDLATVTVVASEDLKIDRNVFIPSKEDLLNIEFKIKHSGSVKLDLHDITGTKITTLQEADYPAGWNSYSWNSLTENGQKIGSGFYIITLRSNGYYAWKKIMIVR